MKNQMLFGHNIDQYFDDMLTDLEAFIAIPSVCDTALGEKPFGRPCRDALDFILNLAKKLGLPTVNVDYYAGEASYGKGESYIDVLTHVDVVPAGEGWESEPYEMIQKGNKLYGRGTADDKGAAIAALYALKALKNAGIEGNYCLRTVFGCGEEIGSDDLDVYYRKRGYPVMGFTPDCSYGICNSEKGILRVDFIAPHSKKSAVRVFQAGLAVNAVPNKAYAEITCSDLQYEALLSLTNGAPGCVDATGISLIREGGTANITALGKAAHGAEPELGENAASKLIKLLYEVYTPEELGSLFQFAAENIGLEYDGSTLGIRMEDKESGALTFNTGIVKVQDGMDILSADIRYPVTASKEQILMRLNETAAAYQISATEVNHMAPLHVPADSFMISAMSDAYQAVTGKRCHIYSTGGGTYARHAHNAVVAFGPIFPDEPPSNAHGPNEHIELTHYLKHSRICLEAMYRLFTAPKPIHP